MHIFFIRSLTFFTELMLNMFVAMIIDSCSTLYSIWHLCASEYNDDNIIFMIDRELLCREFLPYLLYIIMNLTFVYIEHLLLGYHAYISRNRLLSYNNTI